MRILLFLLLLPGFLYAQKSTAWQELFDGKTLDGWEIKAGSAEYSVEEGMIVGRTVEGSPNTFLVSKRKFMDDFILELEIMMEDSTGNSGVQFRSNYDGSANAGRGKIFGYQFEFDPTPRRWSGGIYDEGRREWLYPVSLNPAAQAAFNRNGFNKARIECRGNIVRTWLNDVPVAFLVDTLVANQGLIALQVHAIGNASQAGKKIFFRNIRIRTKGVEIKELPWNVHPVNLQPNDLTSFEKKSGWRLLFDGKSTKGWRSASAGIGKFPEKGWVVKNGALTVQSSTEIGAERGGDIVTEDAYSSFDLSFEFLLAPKSNSGVKYLISLPTEKGGAAIGLEYQLLDDALHPDAIMGRGGNRKLASLYDLIGAEKQPRFTKPVGQWNRGRIVVYPDKRVEHFLNGVKVLEYVRGSDEFLGFVSMSKFAGRENFGKVVKSPILLQDHGDEVSFRSIRIRRLDD